MQDNKDFRAFVKENPMKTIYFVQTWTYGLGNVGPFDL